MALPDNRLMNVTEIKTKIVAGDLKQKSGSTLPVDSPLCPDFDTMDEYVDLDTTTYTNDGYSLERCAPIGSNEFDDYIILASGMFNLKIQASDKYSQGFFGNSVAMNSSGSKCVVGAYKQYTGGIFTGAAYVFAKSGGTWSEEIKFAATDSPAAGDEFGYCVDMSANGDVVIVSAQKKTNGQGAVYVYDKSGGSWVLKTKLTASNPSNDDWFGISCSISPDGNTIIVGATGDDDSASAAGAVYIFENVAGTWTEKQKVQEQYTQSGNRFGVSCAISNLGTRFLAGSKNSITVFQKSGSTWSREIRKIGSDTAIADLFGHSVDISSDGETFVVGAPYQDTGGSSAGAAYIFKYVSSAWTQTYKAQGNPVASDYFGWSVALSDDGARMAAGAIYKSSTSASNGGEAFVFKLDSGSWISDGEALSSDIEDDDRLGESVAMNIDGSSLVVGAIREDTGGPDAGAAYVFTV